MRLKFGMLVGISLIQAIGAGVVLWLWSLFITRAENWIDTSGNEPGVVAMIVLPAVFIITAVASGGAVLGYPLLLVLKGKWYSAIGLVALTLVWLAVLAGVLISLY